MWQLEGYDSPDHCKETAMPYLFSLFTKACRCQTLRRPSKIQTASHATRKYCYCKTSFRILAGHIQCLKNQTSDLPPSPIGPRTFTNHDEQMFSQGGPVPWVPAYWDLSSTQTSSGICKYDPSLRRLWKWLVPCTALASTSLLLLSSTFTRASSGRKWSTAAIYGWEPPSLH